MAICRVEKNGNYTVMSNRHLRDTRLSLKAIGLLSKVLSLPENWDLPNDYNETLVRGLIGEGVPPMLMKNVLKGIK